MAGPGEISMKFVMDERVKHRLTGVVVILSVAVVFLPAMMKKSNQHFDENVSISLKLPSKPIPPHVTIPKQTVMFKSVKVAHVDIPTVTDKPYPSVIAKAEPLSKRPASQLAKITLPAKPVITTAALPAKIIAGMPKSTKEGYGVQLASFAQQRNAEYLVARLRKEGFVATYTKFKGQKGNLYQVIVGSVNQKNDALVLQKKLVNNLQLNGFIVKTGVS